MQEPTYILSAEHIGTAHSEGGKLNIGGLEVPWPDRRVDVFVRRDSKDLSVIEIHIVRHDGLACEALDQQNDEADDYALGPKEYWRARMVGKYTYGPDQHAMTNDEFEEFWEDDNE